MDEVRKPINSVYRRYVPLKRRWNFSRLHGVILQNLELVTEPSSIQFCIKLITVMSHTSLINPHTAVPDSVSGTARHRDTGTSPYVIYSSRNVMGLMVYGDVKVRHAEAFFSNAFWVGVLY
jgi:hypothetical protein